MSEHTGPVPSRGVPPGPNTTGKRRRWLRFALIGAAVVALLLVADWYERNREMDHLLDAMHRSETAMERFKTDLSDDVTPYVNECSSSGPITSTDCQALNQTVRTQISASAASDLVNLQTSGADVQHVGVLPWHGALRDARAAYGEHNKAWLSVVTKTISNPAAAFDKAANANIDATFQTAHHRFDEAVPPFALFHLQHRVDAIFAS